MNILQIIDLKKYYGVNPNIARALITKPAIILAGRIARIEDGRSVAGRR